MKKILVILSLFVLLSSCTKKVSKENKIMVSILPQKYFVERITGDRFEINVLVGNGQSPATYEPLPSQLKQLSQSRLFFRIGVPFENSWIDKIAKNNPELKIVDTRNNIKLREMDSFEEHAHKNEEHHNEHIEHEDGHMQNAKHDEHHHHGKKDPHIWLSPRLVIQQCKTILDAVKKIDPDNTDFYQKNFSEFKKELLSLSDDIKQTFSGVEVREIMVFHPSWGYFCDEFGLKQNPIEIEGKEPSPKQLSKIIAENKDQKFIFVQKQFSIKSAKAIAQEIGATVISIDPLAENYMENLRTISIEIKKALELED